MANDYAFAEDAPMEPNYSGGTSADDFESNLFNSAPSQNWYNDTYNYSGMMPQSDTSYQMDTSNLTNLPPEGWSNSPQIQLSPQEQGAAGFMPTSTNWNPNTSSLGSTMNTLAQLFNSKQGQGLTSGLGALMSGYVNRQKGQQFQQLAQQLQQSGDPFGSQRQQYQQELSRAVQDPYSSPIVRNQVEALQQAQAIKDAAAGRRSNSATSMPAVLAAQAQIAQEYIKSLYTPSGANINPNTSNYMSAMQNAINAKSNGYMSPLASAIGYNQQGNINSDSLAAALQKLQSGGQ